MSEQPTRDYETLVLGKFSLWRDVIAMRESQIEKIAASSCEGCGSGGCGIGCLGCSEGGSKVRPATYAGVVKSPYELSLNDVV